MSEISPLNINPEEIVNLKDEAERIENSPEMMLALVDLIFGYDTSIPS